MLRIVCLAYRIEKVNSFGWKLHSQADLRSTLIHQNLTLISKNCLKSANKDFINAKKTPTGQLTESTLIIATTQPPAFHSLSFARMCLQVVQKLPCGSCHLAAGSSPPGMSSFVLTTLVLIAVQ